MDLSRHPNRRTVDPSIGMGVSYIRQCEKPGKLIIGLAVVDMTVQPTRRITVVLLIPSECCLLEAVGYNCCSPAWNWPLKSKPNRNPA